MRFPFRAHHSVSALRQREHLIITHNSSGIEFRMNSVGRALRCAPIETLRSSATKPKYGAHGVLALPIRNVGNDKA